MTSSLSPFCAETTYPSALKCLASARVAASVSWALTASRTCSNSPWSASGAEESTSRAGLGLAGEAPPVSEAAASPPPAPRAEVAAGEARAPAAAGVGLVLRLEAEREPAPTFEVTRSGATVGRGPENTIRLEDLSVSRRHARISYRQGAYWLSDLGSMGGTWIDGTRLNAARRFVAGQMIDIGVCRLRVTFAGEESEAAFSRRAAPPVRRRSG